MSTLVVDRKGVELRVRQGVVEMRNEGKLQTVPTRLIERLVIQQTVVLDSHSLLELSRGDVGLIVLGRSGEVAQLLGNPHQRASLRLLQYRMFQQDDICQGLSKETVAARLEGELNCLQQALQLRPQQAYRLNKAIRQLQKQRERLIEIPSSLPQLRGIEGGAAAIYFRAYPQLFASSLEFYGRKRRPPTDPVNAVLSLGYALLHSDLVKALWGAGLDPWVGYYHQPAYGHATLASDLLESHRHRIELWCWELFRKQRLVKSHFFNQQGGVRLNKSGRKHFFDEWEAWVGPLRRLLRRQSYQLGHRLQQENRDESLQKVDCNCL